MWWKQNRNWGVPQQNFGWSPFGGGWGGGYPQQQSFGGWGGPQFGGFQPSPWGGGGYGYQPAPQPMFGGFGGYMGYPQPQQQMYNQPQQDQAAFQGERGFSPQTQQAFNQPFVQRDYGGAKEERQQAFGDSGQFGQKDFAAAMQVAQNGGAVDFNSIQQGGGSPEQVQQLQNAMLSRNQSIPQGQQLLSQAYNQRDEGPKTEGRSGGDMGFKQAGFGNKANSNQQNFGMTAAFQGIPQGWGQFKR